MKTYRLPPCLFYDIEGMESWLEEMASIGLFFKKMNHFAVFEKKEPQQVRYRIEPLPKKFSILGNTHIDPLDETIALNESFGWHYITKYLYFAIYMTEDINAPELHTDPEIQALTYERIIKKLKHHALFGILLIAFLCYLISLIGVTRFLADLPNSNLIFMLLIFIIEGTNTFLQYKFIFQIRKHLQDAKPLSHNKNYKQHSKFYYVLNTISYLLALFFSIYCLNQAITSETNDHAFTLSNYQETVPFNTLQDLINLEDDEYTSGKMDTLSNLFVNESIKFEEILAYSNPDEPIKCHLTVEYYDFKIEKMATAMAKDIYKKDERWHSDNKAFKVLETSQLPEGTIYHYQTINHVEIIIVVKDHQTIMISLYQPQEEKISIEQWSKALTQKFLSKEGE